MGSYLFLFALAAFMPQPINNISQAHNPAINPVVPMLSNCNFSATLNIFTTIVPHKILVITAFILLGFIAFRSSKHDEQNRVWIGLAKETAHQLGTPLSLIHI